MALDPTARNGSKGANRTVHMEHGVPVAVLVKALRHHLSNFTGPCDLHDFLIHHSVCVALSHEEELLLRKARVDGSRNRAFNDDGCIVHCHPFLRYQPLIKLCPEFRLYEVVSGDEIPIDQFKFADHVATLEKASRQVMPIGAKHTIYSIGLFNLWDLGGA